MQSQVGLLLRTEVAANLDSFCPSSSTRLLQCSARQPEQPSDVLSISYLFSCPVFLLPLGDLLAPLTFVVTDVALIISEPTFPPLDFHVRETSPGYVSRSVAREVVSCKLRPKPRWRYLYNT